MENQISLNEMASFHLAYNNRQKVKIIVEPLTFRDSGHWIKVEFEAESTGGKNKKTKEKRIWYVTVPQNEDEEPDFKFDKQPGVKNVDKDIRNAISGLLKRHYQKFNAAIKETRTGADAYTIDKLEADLIEAGEKITSSSKTKQSSNGNSSKRKVVNVEEIKIQTVPADGKGRKSIRTLDPDEEIPKVGDIIESLPLAVRVYKLFERYAETFVSSANRYRVGEVVIAPDGEAIVRRVEPQSAKLLSADVYTYYVEYKNERGKTMWFWGRELKRRD